jgi:hypothetical protein
MTPKTPGDEPFLEETLDAQLDAQLDALTQTLDQPPVTATSRAYRALAHLHAPAAAQEAEAIERVRGRLASHVEEELELPLAPEPPDTLPEYRARQVRPRSHERAIANSAAALLVVGALLGGFFALLHPGGSTSASSAYPWQIVPSANTSLAVNGLTGVTVRTSADAWAWGVANEAPSSTNSNPIQTPLVERWDGQQWRIVATPSLPYGGQIARIAALAPDNAWAVGGLLITPTSSDNTTGATLIEH